MDILKNLNKKQKLRIIAVLIVFILFVLPRLDEATQIEECFTQSFNSKVNLI